MDDFSMPPIQVGRQVLYYLDGDKGSTPSAAIVLRAAGSSVTLIAFTDYSTGSLHDGVMHVDDPRIQNMYNDSGSWDYLEFEKGLMHLVGPKRGPGRPKKEPEPAGT